MGEKKKPDEGSLTMHTASRILVGHSQRNTLFTVLKFGIGEANGRLVLPKRVRDACVDAMSTKEQSQRVWACPSWRRLSPDTWDPKLMLTF